MSYRSWCFTLNNYTDEDIANISDWADVKRCVVGREVGESGTPHLQGWVVFAKPRRLGSCRKLPSGDKMHWEKTRSDQAAEKYCSKDNDICININNRKTAGVGMKDFVEDIKAGQSEIQLLENHPGYLARYPNFPKRVRLLTRQAQSKQRTPPTILWIHGATGVGKTRWVVEREDELDIVTFQGPFLLGLTGAAAVLFDDFRAKQVDFAFLLRLLDRYSLSVPVKGGELPWIPERIYITTTHEPEKTFFNGEDLGQLRRRLTAVLHAPDDLLAWNVALPLPLQDQASNTVGQPDPTLNELTFLDYINMQ